MQREQKPIIIVHERRFDFVLHLVRLAAELRAVVSHLNRLPVLILPFVRDLAALRLPLPHVTDFKQSGNFPVPGVADRFNLAIRIEAIRFGDLVENWRALLRPGSSSQDQHHAKKQATTPY